MALHFNSVTLPIGYNIISPVPLDGRTVAQYKQDLIDKAVWAKDKAYQYIGMPVYVQEDQSIYVLIEEIDYKNLLDFSNPKSLPSEKQKNELYKAWKKLASASDVSSLSGVFKFKGIAEAVSPDLSYIVTCSAKSDKSILPVGTSADLTGDLYYGWETEGDRFWTDSSILNSESVQYIRLEPVLVWGIEYKDDFYFPVNAMPAGGDDESVELQNQNGDSIFISLGSVPTSSGSSYPVYNSEEAEIGTGLGFSYTGYTFTEVVDSYPIIHTHTTIQANEDNSGHVYQIGENEYASNGQIWVKLGSPVEDWIII